MKKQSKRRIRPVSDPALVRLATNPEIGIAHRLAIQSIRGGWADYNNSYRVLSDCHGVLTIGAKRRKDDSMRGVLSMSMIALLNIYDRYQTTKKFEATDDELKALEILVDTSDDFWKRQTAVCLEIAIVALRRVRDSQIAEAQQKLKKDA